MSITTRSRVVMGLALAAVSLAVATGLVLAGCGGARSTAEQSPATTSGGDPGVGATLPAHLVWRYQTGAAVRSSPVVSHGVVYVGSDDGHLYAVDVQSGRQRWAFKTGGKVRGSPAVAGGAVFCRSGDGYLYAVDGRSGRLRWRFKAGGPAASCPAVSGGMVYIGTSTGRGPDDGYLYALDSRSGRQRWKVKTGGDYHANTACPASPAVGGGVVYFGMGSLDGFDARTGERTWHYNPGAVFRATPAVSRGAVYFRATGFLPGVNAVHTAEGRKSQEPIRWFFMAGWPVCSSPVVSGGVVYCTGSTEGEWTGPDTSTFAPTSTVFLHALDARSGREKWRSEAIGDTAYSCAPAVAGGLVCVGGGKDGTLYALDTRNGQEEWQFKTGAAIRSSPAISKGVVYVGSDDGCLYALEEDRSRQPREPGDLQTER